MLFFTNNFILLLGCKSSYHCGCRVEVVSQEWFPFMISYFVSSTQKVITGLIVEVPKALSSQFVQCGYLVVGHYNNSLQYHVCLVEMQKGGHTSCAARRLQLKWLVSVPFIHPKDFYN
jgi:hypothetical protein